MSKKDFKKQLKSVKQNMKRNDSMNSEYQKVADSLLDKYGPEGAFEISDKLRQVAYEDMEQGVQQSIQKSKRSNFVLGDFDVWYEPCKNCGYDTAKSRKLPDPRCWRCGSLISRDYTERALKKSVKQKLKIQ